jgi:Helix-turn-helix domain
MKPSAAAVLDLLRERGPLGATDLDALERCGTTRLAARVHELRAEGHDIRSELVSTASGKRVSRYVLREAAQMEMRL